MNSNLMYRLQIKDVMVKTSDCQEWKHIGLSRTLRHLPKPSFSSESFVLLPIYTYNIKSTIVLFFNINLELDLSAL